MSLIRRKRPSPKKLFIVLITLSFVATLVLMLLISERINMFNKFEYKKSINFSLFTSHKSTDPEAEKLRIDTKEESADDDVKKKTSGKSVPVVNEIVEKEAKVNSIINSMSLEEKIGQLMVVGFQNTSVDYHIKTMIENYHVGGIILYDRNMDTPEQVASLNKELQALAKKNGQKLPLITSIDQEGGSIVRMRDKVSPIPSQQELGLKGNSKLVYDVAYRSGRELANIGISVNFAPVLDMSDIDTRSFGSDPKKTAVLGTEVVSGMFDAGIEATLKHFPGNGRSNIDPHLETSSVQADQWALENSDIYPFKKIIKEVDNNRFFVMVTHIKYPAYDKENPASISTAIMHDLLRDKLGYKGIVVTDDLEMGAVNKYFTYEDLGYKAIDSGADLLLVCHTLENQKRVFKGILEAVKTKKLKEERINEAVKRVISYKFDSFTSH